MEIDIILLGILSGGNFFGYEIMKIIKSVMVDIAEVTTGTLYYKLKKLERGGFLTSASEREGQRPQRQRYTITEAGRSEFIRLATENISRRKRPYWPYLSSLFFVQYLPAGETLRALRQKADMLEETRRRLLATRLVVKGRDYPFHAALLVEHGLLHLEVDIAWLHKFARALERKGAGLNKHLYGRDAWERHMKAAPPSKGSFG